MIPEIVLNEINSTGELEEIHYSLPSSSFPANTSFQPSSNIVSRSSKSFTLSDDEFYDNVNYSIPGPSHLQGRMDLQDNRSYNSLDLQGSCHQSIDLQDNTSYNSLDPQGSCHQSTDLQDNKSYHSLDLQVQSFDLQDNASYSSQDFGHVVQDKASVCSFHEHGVLEESHAYDDII